MYTEAQFDDSVLIVKLIKMFTPLQQIITRPPMVIILLVGMDFLLAKVEKCKMG